jgi:hypothetical protein
VIGLYELLGNPTTQLIEPPGPSGIARKKTVHVPTVVMEKIIQIQKQLALSFVGN